MTKLILDDTSVQVYNVHCQQNGILAQLGEHLPYKQRVTGSSPVGPTYPKGYASVAELADAQDLKSCCSDTVPVRFRSEALVQRLDAE